MAKQKNISFPCSGHHDIDRTARHLYGMLLINEQTQTNLDRIHQLVRNHIDTPPMANYGILDVLQLIPYERPLITMSVLEFFLTVFDPEPFFSNRGTFQRYITTEINNGHVTTEDLEHIALLITHNTIGADTLRIALLHHNPDNEGAFFDIFNFIRDFRGMEDAIIIARVMNIAYPENRMKFYLKQQEVYDKSYNDSDDDDQSSSGTPSIFMLGDLQSSFDA